MGERHNNIDLGNGVIVVSKGKLTLEEYGKELMESSLGVSLMLSPHPSYPPLEMAYFDILTVTNNYANKNLSKKHSNLLTVDSCCPQLIAERLFDAATLLVKNDKIAHKKPIFDSSYVNGKEQFEWIGEISKELIG